VNAGTISGFVNGETQSSATTGTLLFSTTASATSNVGSYAINGGGLTANHGNYTFTQAPANSSALTINQKALAITASDQSMTNGTALTLGTTAFTSSGLVNSDSVLGVTLTQGGNTTVPATQAVGTYSGSVNGILASAATGSGLGNYAITYTSGVLTIKESALSPPEPPPPLPPVITALPIQAATSSQTKAAPSSEGAIPPPVFPPETRGETSASGASTARKTNVDRVASSTNVAKGASSTKAGEVNPPSSPLSDDQQRQDNAQGTDASALLQHRNERKLTKAGYGFEKRVFSDPQFKLAYGINDSNIEQAIMLYRSIGGVV
jgi:hypothetical protein